MKASKSRNVPLSVLSDIDIDKLNLQFFAVATTFALVFAASVAGRMDKRVCWSRCFLEIRTDQ